MFFDPMIFHENGINLQLHYYMIWFTLFVQVLFTYVVLYDSALETHNVHSLCINLKMYV